MKAEVILEGRSHIRQHLYIGPGAEELVTFPSNHDHLNSIIHPCGEDRAIKLLHHFIAVSVCWRIVQRQNRNATLNVVFDEHPLFSKSWLSISHVSEFQI